MIFHDWIVLLLCLVALLFSALGAQKQQVISRVEEKLRESIRMIIISVLAFGLVAVTVLAS